MSENDNNKLAFNPLEHIKESAHINSMEEYNWLCRLSMDDRETFCSKQAERISWFNKWPKVFDCDFKNM